MAAVAVGITVSLPVASSQAAEPKKEVNALMQRKLHQSQKVLEGIAINDFEKIANGAEELIEISKAAEWKVLKDPQYELFSNEFRRRADQVVKSAKEKNLDSATLGYLELTLTCVRCHKHVREQRRTGLDLERDTRLGD
jgi:hypothetical protein